MNRILAAFAAALLTAGCETESSDQIAVAIYPNNATLSKGQSREFTASGWRDYSWSLSDPSIGVLSTTKGDSTTYTAVKGSSSEDTNLTQILTLSISLPVESADTGTSTNTIPGTVDNVTAQALILHTYTP
jgi:hypothetical protein